MIVNYALEVTNKLLDLGFKNIKPWNVGTVQRIYQGNAYIELIGKFNFQAVNLDSNSELVIKAREIFNELKNKDRQSELALYLEPDNVPF